MQKFTSEEHAKFKAADPDDVVCVRVGQIAVLIEQNEQLLAKDVRSEEEKAEYRSKNAVLEQRISDLNRSSKLNSHNSSKPPSSDGLSKETVEKKNALFAKGMHFPCVIIETVIESGRYQQWTTRNIKVGCQK